MPSACAGQVRLDYFFHKGKVDYQAVIQYSRALGYFLNETERSFLPVYNRLHGAVWTQGQLHQECGFHGRTAR